jgi:hypothetical protein
MKKKVLNLLTKPHYLFGFFILLVLLHNAIYAIIRFEEPLVFLASLVVFIAMLVSITLELIKLTRKARKKR